MVAYIQLLELFALLQKLSQLLIIKLAALIAIAQVLRRARVPERTWISASRILKRLHIGAHVLRGSHVVVSIFWYEALLTR